MTIDIMLNTCHSNQVKGLIDYDLALRGEKRGHKIQERVNYLPRHTAHRQRLSSSKRRGSGVTR